MKGVKSLWFRQVFELSRVFGYDRFSDFVHGSVKTRFTSYYVMGNEYWGSNV